MNPQDPVTRDSIDRLFTLADLPLPAERRARLVPMLSGLATAANDLGRKMAHAGYRMIVPIARFPERAGHRRDVPSGRNPYATVGGRPAYDFTVAEDDGRRALHLKSHDDHSTIVK